MRASRLVLVMLSLAAVALAAGYFWIFPIETSRDRERILRAVAVPSDFLLIARESEGSRSRLANDAPVSTVIYSAQWDDGALCARLEGIASKLGRSDRLPTARFPAAACAYGAKVGSGWQAYLVNEPHYQISFRAYRPGELPPPISMYANRLEPAATIVVITIAGKVGF